MEEKQEMFSRFATFLFTTLGVSGLLLLSGCWPDSSDDGDCDPRSCTETTSSSSTSTSSGFGHVPVQSPVDTDGLSAGRPSAARAFLRSMSALAEPVVYYTAAERYEQSVDRINNLLTGTTALSDTFTPNLFFAYDERASCFGPQLLYDNHYDATVTSPDATSCIDDTTKSCLPTGDLGLWNTTEVSIDTTSTPYTVTDSTEACAAAQLNARMEGLKTRSFIALSTVASMIYAYVNAGNTWPGSVTAGSTIDLTTEMNAAGYALTTFTSATMAKDATKELWTYNVELVYNRVVDSVTVPTTIILAMEHFSDTTQTQVYEGLLTYRVNDSEVGGGNCSSTDDITRNGSLHYIRNGETDMVYQSRGGEFCDHDTNGLVIALSTIYPTTQLAGSVVTPAESGALYWSNNFHYFTAEYDPTSANLAGRYSYVWQAGNDDSHSRILNIGLNSGGAAGTGETYYGFGASVENMSSTTSPYYGEISGFICNWAGPGSTKTVHEYAQRQNITQSSTTGIYEPTNTGASDITYAPTNTCLYDGTAGSFYSPATFTYDRNLNGVIASPGDIYIVDDGTSGLTFDLMEPSGSESTIWGHITNNRNYSLPDYP